MTSEPCDTAEQVACHLGVVKDTLYCRLANPGEMQPEQIVLSSFGCITHLQSGTGILVRHRVEFLDEALNKACVSRRRIA